MKGIEVKEYIKVLQPEDSPTNLTTNLSTRVLKT